MNAPQLARFLAPTPAEDAAHAADDSAARLRFDYAERVALAAMQAGVAGHVVNVMFSRDETLADMLSEHTSNYRVDIDAPNPCNLLSTLVAVALRSSDARVKAAADDYARRIAMDYAVSHEVTA